MENTRNEIIRLSDCVYPVFQPEKFIIDYIDYLQNFENVDMNGYCFNLN